jgi:hypothetical protein
MIQLISEKYIIKRCNISRRKLYDLVESEQDIIIDKIDLTRFYNVNFLNLNFPNVDWEEYYLPEKIRKRKLREV